MSDEALFTALLLWAILNGSRNNNSAYAAGWLFVVMLLFGLDFSVHRTNLLLLPGVFIWMVLCYPRTFLGFKNWIAGGFGLTLGLAFHLLIMPMAARNPVLNASDPSNWSRFYYYISLQQYGGSWLVNMWSPVLRTRTANEPPAGSRSPKDSSNRSPMASMVASVSSTGENDTTPKVRPSTVRANSGSSQSSQTLPLSHCTRHSFPASRKRPWISFNK